MSAYDVGQKPLASSSAASVLTPNVEYRVLSSCPLRKNTTTLPSRA